jgi:hypothetical protein
VALEAVMPKATHEEARYRPGRLGRRCGNCSMFRDDIEPSHPRALDPGTEADSWASCTSVVSPIRARDVCDYFVKSEALPR